MVELECSCIQHLRINEHESVKWGSHLHAPMVESNVQKLGIRPRLKWKDKDNADCIENKCDRQDSSEA